MDNAYAIIMAGGRGERFWPLSTRKRPKQVLSLVGGKPLIAMAVDRLAGLVPPERVIVITNADLVETTRNAAHNLPPENIIGEPFGRDTAAACALGCALVKARDPEGVFCILTSDHIIRDIPVFQSTLREGFELALKNDVLITIGINPTSPSTGYGYIEAEPDAVSDGAIAFVKARRFVEKPDQATAQSYLEHGNYYWNSGMFIWSVKSFEKALSTHEPPLAEMVSRLEPTAWDPGLTERLEKEYKDLRKISVDYAIMEKADNILTAVGTFRWSDVGSWPALKDHFDADKDGNVLIGECEIIDARNNIVVSEERLTALIGVEDIVVVQAEGATLVCIKDQAEHVKSMVKQLDEAGRHDLL